MARRLASLVWLLVACGSGVEGEPPDPRYDHGRCDRIVGYWMAEGELGPAHCIDPAPDAGKRCTTSTECASYCSPVDAGVGACFRWMSPIGGCWDFLVEGEIVTGCH